MVHFISMLPVKPNSQFKIHQPSFKILLISPQKKSNSLLKLTAVSAQLAGHDLNQLDIIIGIQVKCFLNKCSDKGYLSY